MIDRQDPLRSGPPNEPVRLPGPDCGAIWQQALTPASHRRGTTTTAWKGRPSTPRVDVGPIPTTPASRARMSDTCCEMKPVVASSPRSIRERCCKPASATLVAEMAAASMPAASRCGWRRRSDAGSRAAQAGQPCGGAAGDMLERPPGSHFCPNMASELRNQKCTCAKTHPTPAYIS